MHFKHGSFSILSVSMFEVYEIVIYRIYSVPIKVSSLI